MARRLLSFPSAVALRGAQEGQKAMERNRGRRGESGFSISEMLVVVAIVGLATVIAIPLVSEQVRAAKARSAADQLAVDLKAARMIAVSKRATLNFTIHPDPGNYYEYAGTDGTTRRITLPLGVRIVTPSSTSTIAFQPNGALSSAFTTQIETTIDDDEAERWTITTSVLGVSTSARCRVAS